MKNRERAIVSISLAWHTPNYETHHFYFNRISMQFIKLKIELYQSYISEHPFLKVPPIREQHGNMIISIKIECQGYDTQLNVMNISACLHEIAIVN